MSEQVIDGHKDMHSEQGGLPGEHPGRSANPLIKVQDVSWLEFEKPDLVKAEAFAHAFGFSTALRTDEELHLRGSDADAPCVLIRRGARERFVGPAFVAAEQSDLLRLADATGASVRPLPETLGGVTVDLVDPSGLPVRVVSGTHQLEALPAQTPHVFNFGHKTARANATQRPPRVPTTVQRLGHVVLQTPKYIEALNWYLDTLGMIVSDFCHYPGQRERGPILSFIRCDRGSVPADHHTLAMALGPVKRYVHSAYQVCDLDALAAGGEYLRPPAALVHLATKTPAPSTRMPLPAPPTTMITIYGCSSRRFRCEKECRGAGGDPSAGQASLQARGGPGGPAGRGCPPGAAGYTVCSIRNARAFSPCAVLPMVTARRARAAAWSPLVRTLA
jgi:hypothetical protein